MLADKDEIVKQMNESFQRREKEEAERQEAERQEAQQIVASLKQSGWTLQEIADEIGIHRVTISNILHGTGSRVTGQKALPKLRGLEPKGKYMDKRQYRQTRRTAREEEAILERLDAFRKKEEREKADKKYERIAYDILEKAADTFTLWLMESGRYDEYEDKLTDFLYNRVGTLIEEKIAEAWLREHTYE
jgi:transcriptional regulator with XRE-family HTH domain